MLFQVTMKILTCTADEDLLPFLAIHTAHRHMNDVATNQPMETVMVVVVVIVIVAQCLQWVDLLTTGAHHLQPITHNHVPDLNIAEELHLLAQWVTPSKLGHHLVRWA